MAWALFGLISSPHLNEREQSIFTALCFVFFLPNNIALESIFVPTYLPHSFLLLHTLLSSPTLSLLFSLKTSSFGRITLLVDLLAFVHTLLVLVGISRFDLC